MSCSSPASSSSLSSSASSSMWADIPNDILELQVRSTDSPLDRLRFGAVCRSWRDVAVAAAAAAAKQNPAGRSGVGLLPMMTFSDPDAPEEVDDGDAGGGNPVTRCFYSLSEDKVYRLQVQSESRDWRSFGCSRGWLGMIDLSAKPFLFNPL